MPTIEIEDYYPHPLRKRYGGRLPPHPFIFELLSSGEVRYKNLLRQANEHLDVFQTLQYRDAGNNEPYWDNGFFPFLDIAALYTIVATKAPRTYLEVGSGNSTKVTNLARKQNNLPTRIISIDPTPRAEIDAICDETIRKPLQDADLGIVETLEPGDILFFDGSHRILQDSDTQVIFFEVIPLLKPGVLIHIHDIYWPHDYGDDMAQRMYSEQYPLGAMLLYAPEKFEVLFPAAYVSIHMDYQSEFERLWNREGFEGIQRYGSSFWLTKRP